MECLKLKHRTRNDAIYFQIKTALKVGDNRPFRVYQCSECSLHHVTYKPHFDDNKPAKTIFYRKQERILTKDELQFLTSAIENYMKGKM